MTPPQDQNRISLAQFAGTWTVHRRIEHADGTEATFDGVAEFTPSGGGLDYRERGVLTLPQDTQMRAERGYRWAEDGPMIHVAFADGRPFHSFDPGRPEAVHDCPPDRYHVCYDFGAWPSWRAIWTVSGPQKDYRMISRYRRGYSTFRFT